MTHPHLGRFLQILKVELVNDGEKSGEKSLDFGEFFGQAIHLGILSGKNLADWLDPQ